MYHLFVPSLSYKLQCLKSWSCRPISYYYLYKCLSFIASGSLFYCQAGQTFRVEQRDRVRSSVAVFVWAIDIQKARVKNFDNIAPLSEVNNGWLLAENTDNAHTRNEVPRFLLTFQRAGTEGAIGVRLTDYKSEDFRHLKIIQMQLDVDFTNGIDVFKVIGLPNVMIKP